MRVWIALKAFWRESFQADSPSADVCMSQFYTSQDDFEKYRIQYELFLFDDATQSLTTAVRNLDPLVTACVSSTVEYVDVAVFYAYTF